MGSMALSWMPKANRKLHLAGSPHTINRLGDQVLWRFNMSILGISV